MVYLTLMTLMARANKELVSIKPPHIMGKEPAPPKTYLKSVTNSDRLTLKLNTQVNRIIIRDGQAVGVAYQGKNGHEVEAFAREEVLVCSGAMGSAKLLMLSGIGPEEHLSALGIKTVANLPVGENFHDHLHMSINVTTKEPIQLIWCRPRLCRYQAWF
ncbi:Choline dehydrogenase [Providencia alcalifaciens]|nr:Choline dehydrogenase [Providencia alcalifaciens]